MLETRLAPAAAALSVIGFVAWLALSRPGGPAPEPPPSEVSAAPTAVAPTRASGAGSAVPCAAPLGWRIADIDPRFGLSAASATAAVQRAAAAWEQATGRALFVPDSAGALPIRFVYDERQAGVGERKRLDASMDAVDAGLRREVGDMATRRGAFEQTRAAYRQRLAAYESWSKEHGDTVRSWNAGAGAPPAVAAELRASQQELDRERRELLALGRELDEGSADLEAEAEALNRKIDQHNRRSDDLAKALPESRVESGLYRERVQQEGNRVVAIQRVIEIYQYDGEDELKLVIAHEMGHALGLGHAIAPGAVMSAAHLRGVRATGELQPEDLALLRGVCPALTVSGPRRP
ncbi:MAG: matrixin family metalloprotease [Gemmatimonadetes bacterium]|nr:matrixin family metalloprotease [Gemmatimonadota bacterium]